MAIRKKSGNQSAGLNLRAEGRRLRATSIFERGLNCRLAMLCCRARRSIFRAGSAWTQNRKIPEDVEAEARNVLEDVRGVLSRAKMTMSDLVYLQVFCTDVSLWERFNVVYRTFFNGHMPARAFLGSGPLLFGAHFEIQGIAVRR